MKNVEKSATIQEPRLSQQIATNDDVADNEEEIDEQIEEGNVEKAARENATGFPVSLVNNKQIETNDDDVASREEVEEQEEESRIARVAYENGMSTALAKEYIQRGRTHD